MEYLELVRKRRSIRRYEPDPVPDEILNEMLEAARLAPSWANRQCWHYVIVKDEATRKKLAEANGGKWIAEAPVIVAVCADPKASGHKPGLDYFMLDVGISFEHLILAAANRGLGTCWIGWFDEKKAKEALEVPDSLRVVAYTPVGYPAEEKGEVSNRKSLREICFYEKYGIKLSGNGQKFRRGSCRRIRER